MEADVSMDGPGRNTDGFDPADQASKAQASGGRTAGDQASASPGDEARRGKRPQSEATLDQLARDWITIWQSEIGAMALDPEIRESWRTMMASGTAAWSALISGWPRPSHEHAHPSSRSADAPRPAPAAAASEPRDAEIERLTRDVAALERRLAELERNDSAVNPERRPKRKSRK